MARDDYMLDKPDKNDIKQFEDLIRKALLAKRKIESGFLELAESIFDIHQKRLYKIKYRTFSEFCEEGLGFSKQTIYIYISILKLIHRFPNYFSREKALEFGHKKMRFITEGVNAVDKKIEDDNSKNRIINEILENVNPKMASTEIEAFIEDKIIDL